MNRWVVNAAIVVVLSCTGLLPVQAAQSTNDALLACAKEADDASRLRCFDSVVAALRRAPPVMEAAVAATAGTASAAAAKSSAVPQSPEDKFGARGDLNPEKREALQEITGTVTEVGTRAHGELVVTLDNGQVWAEKTAGSKVKVKAGDAVKIEAGALGSFVLIAPNGRSSKVARVR